VMPGRPGRADGKRRMLRSTTRARKDQPHERRWKLEVVVIPQSRMLNAPSLSSHGASVAGSTRHNPECVQLTHETRPPGASVQFGANHSARPSRIGQGVPDPSQTIAGAR